MAVFDRTVYFRGPRGARMRHRSNVSPEPLPVEREEAAITIEYRDGRRVTYRGQPEERDGSVTATMGYEIHVLVTDPAVTEGMVVYVHDTDTSDEILRHTGVGRVLLDEGAEAAVYPGVHAARGRDRIEVVADPDAIDGRVYAFVENQLEERAYRLV